jgi:hypothetical protein
MTEAEMGTGTINSGRTVLEQRSVLECISSELVQKITK